jgi:oligosaccharyltransferase complex subunit alpha (ribophorin I)
LKPFKQSQSSPLCRLIQPRYVLSFRDVKFILVELAKTLEPGKETTVDVETVFAHAMHAYPAQITQAEKQFVKFTGNAYVYSPYRAQTQTTTVNCATSSVDSFTKERPSTQADKAITYGPYDDVPPFKQVGARVTGVCWDTVVCDLQCLTMLEGLVARENL